VLSLQSDDSEAKQGIEIARSQLQANGLLAAGMASMNEGKYSDAAAYLEQAQKIKPRDKTIQTLLADARAKSAPATNLEDIKASAEMWAIYLKGLEAYQAGNYSDAIRNWESLRQSYPNNPDLEKNISQARQRISTEGGARQE
jgi:outer membrane protein assembly factor BamD (BamD/ComL family)